MPHAAETKTPLFDECLPSGMPLVGGADRMEAALRQVSGEWRVLDSEPTYTRTPGLGPDHSGPIHKVREYMAWRRTRNIARAVGGTSLHTSRQILELGYYPFRML
jgi:hypothetical protein